jgi:hypothetical protein
MSEIEILVNDGNLESVMNECRIIIIMAMGIENE